MVYRRDGGRQDCNIDALSLWFFSVKFSFVDELVAPSSRLAQLNIKKKEKSLQDFFVCEQKEKKKYKFFFK